jgi:hypothetical protein
VNFVKLCKLCHKRPYRCDKNRIADTHQTRREVGALVQVLTTINLYKTPKISMQARRKIITCFIAPAILKIMKIGDLRINACKIHDNSD